VDESFKNETVLRRLYQREGKTQSEIAEEYDCSADTVRYWLDKFDIKTRNSQYERREFFENEEQELKRLYWVEQLTADEIADRANVDVTDVGILNRMEEYGIDRRNSAADRPPGVYIHPSEYPYVRHYDGESEHIVFTHRLLAVSEYGFEAVKGNDVHHTTGFKQDNRPEAIEVISHSDHQGEHSSNPGDSPFIVDDLSDAAP